MNTKRTIIALAILALGAAQAQTTWYSTGNNKNCDDTATWNDMPDGSGSAHPGLPAGPGADGDTYVIQDGDRIYANPSNGTFFGGTLRIEISGSNDGDFLLWREDFTVQDVILDGGAVTVGDSNDKTMTGGTLTMNSGIIGHELANASRTVKYDFDSYTGSGDIYLQGRGNGSPDTNKNGRILFVDNGDFSTFTGSLTIQWGTVAGFDFDVADGGTFALAVEHGGGTYQGRFNLLNDVTVTTLQAGPDFLPPGTYTLDTVTNPAATDLTNVGGTDYSAYFEDNGGTITATTAGTITPPSVTQGIAESIDETIASIPGTVTDTGGETPTLTIYYDTEDGGTNTTPGPGGWDFSKAVGPTFGDFYEQLTGLTNNTTYFYRCHVSNSAGDAWADFSDSFTTATVPATVVTAQDGAIDDSPTWTGSPPIPTSGDSKTWVIQHEITAGFITWYGGTTQIDSGWLQPIGGDVTVQDVVLNGGWLRKDNVNQNLSGGTLTLNSGTLRMDRKNNLTLSFDDYVGSGTIKVTGNNPQNGKPLTLTSSQPDAFDGFTGTFQCDVLNGVGAALRFGIDITNPTFGILLTETEEIQTGAGITGRYDLTNDVTVTSLKIKDYQDVAGEDVLVLDYTFAPGTYTLDTTANPGATDLSNVDGTGLDLSPHFVDGGGTITVDSGTAADPYGDWAADAGGNFLGTLTDSNPDLDFDGGGLETGIEWVVGGDPTDPSDDAGKAPTFDNTSDPDKFLFVYRRTDDANADANTSIAAQYGSDLMGWTNAVHQGTEPGDITITEDDDFFGAGIGRVTVAIPRSLAVDAKLFARLEVAVTTTP